MAGENPILTGMAGRYATALFELAKDKNSLDQVMADLSQFQSMLNESADLRAFVESPLYSAETQARAVGALLRRANISGLTANFIGLVAKNRRLFAVSDMIKAFGLLLSQHRGEVSADVTSAAPLTEMQLDALKNSLKDSLGKDVAINTAVDPALLGGLVVKIGSRMIDSSIRTKLNNLKLAMKEVG